MVRYELHYFGLLANVSDLLLTTLLFSAVELAPQARTRLSVS